MEKKVLIVTYYWPPSGGGGVQRWLKFAKYLPEFGWSPIIFTPENPDFDLKDKSLDRDVNEQIEVLKFPIWEPYHIFKKISGKKELKQGQVLEEGRRSILGKLAIWLRGNLLIPDPKRFWIKPSVEYLNSIIASNNIKTVITTGPPHSMHLIGLKLKTTNPSINWIADFRDPWSQWDLLDKFSLSSFARKKHQQLESQVFTAAHRVLTVSDSWKREFESLGARRVKVITNGFDLTDIPDQNIEASDKFRISHVGMLNDFRNPGSLWAVLSDLVRENPDLKDDLEIKLVGILSEGVNNSLMSNEHLRDLVALQEYLPHKEVFDVYSQSSVLLLILNDSKNSSGHLPGKLFEYLASGTPILGLGDPNGDASKILYETNSGLVYDSKDHTALKNHILSLYSNWKNGVRIEQTNVDQFERRNLTAKLVEVLEEL